MNKFKSNFNAVLQELKLEEKAKAKTLTKREWGKIAAKYKEMHGSDLYEDIAASDEEEQVSAEKVAAHDKALEILSQAGGDPKVDPDEESEETADEDAASKGSGKKKNDLEKKVESVVKNQKKILEENKTMRTALEKVHNEDEEVKKKVVIVGGAAGIGMKHTNDYLFGVSNSIYSMESRWNKLFTNPALIHSMGDPDPGVGNQFNVEFSAFSQSMAKAYNALHAKGQLNAKSIREDIKNGTIDTTALTDAGLGDQFVQFRVLELIARVLEVPSVTDIFPLRSGVQDRELITNAYVGELTQAYQDSESALKGSSVLQPEMGYVDDAMILSKFGSFKTMERQYIAYLNTNGSDPVKWAMIEYFTLLYMMQARKEQSIRFIRGIYAKPTADVPGHYLNASTGILYRLVTYYMERKTLPFLTADVADYDDTGSVFIEAVIEMFNKTHEAVVSHDGNLDNKKMYLNANHKPWYKRGYRALYNLDQDFSGIDVSKVPDTDMEIVWVPNMGQLKFMWITEPGNLQLLENIPGEMFKVYMERRLNNVYIQSSWKEGSSAAYAGKKEASLAALSARNYLDQSIFMNRPSATLAEDATTADAANGFWFVSSANTGATNITTISNKVSGVGYIIECGSTTNAPTVNKTGDFSEITANFVPTAVGDMLFVIWDSNASKFKELARIVGGTLSWNAALQPNPIGAR